MIDPNANESKLKALLSTALAKLCDEPPTFDNRAALRLLCEEAARLAKEMAIDARVRPQILRGVTRCAECDTPETAPTGPCAKCGSTIRATRL